MLWLLPKKVACSVCNSKCVVPEVHAIQINGQQLVLGETPANPPDKSILIQCISQVAETLPSTKKGSCHLERPDCLPLGGFDCYYHFLCDLTSRNDRYRVREARVIRDSRGIWGKRG